MHKSIVEKCIWLIKALQKNENEYSNDVVHLFFLLAHAPQREITAKTLTAEVGHCNYFRQE